YDGVELRCDADQGHGVEAWASAGERKVIRKQLAASGVEPCCLATGIQLMDEETLPLAEERLQLAVDLRCTAVRVLCGPVPGSIVPELAAGVLGERLRHLARLAESANVEVWLETHDTVSRAADAAAAVRAAMHPMVGINNDNLHPFRRGEPLKETADALAGLIRY